MTTAQRLVIVGGLGLAAWWYYQRSRGLTITGEPINPMLPSPVRLNQQSLVERNTSTSTLATNVFSAIGSSLQTILRSLQPAAGNGPRVASSTQTGIAQSDILNRGQASPALLVAAAPGSEVIQPDPTLDEVSMFWQWLPPVIPGSYASAQYDAGGFAVPDVSGSNQAGTLR